MTQPHAAQAEPKPRGKLTNADYLAITPPENSGPRYQLIQGELVQMAAQPCHIRFFQGASTSKWHTRRTAFK